MSDEFDFSEAFYVIAVRSGGSMFGAAEAPIKDRKGNIKTFDCMKKAKRHARKLNRETVSNNVRYFASETDY